MRPPKTAGREQFGAAYAADLLSSARKHRVRPEDLVRTATIFTALSIVGAFRQFVLPRTKVRQVIVAGGGTKNPLIMAQLQAALREIEIVPSSEFGIAAEAKEAFAFAILAYEAFHGRANNLPSATGAKHSVVMGKLVHGRTR
jgi:anhydro-N-acetylmuramic acid kinase